MIQVFQFKSDLILIKNKRTKRVSVMGSVRGFRSQDIFLRTIYKLISRRLAPLETKIPGERIFLRVMQLQANRI